MWFQTLAFAILVAVCSAEISDVEPAPTGGATANMVYLHGWSHNAQGKFTFKHTKPVIGWLLTIKFDRKVTAIQCSDGTINGHSADGRTWKIVAQSYKLFYPAGTPVEVQIQATYEGADSPKLKAVGTLTNLGDDHWVVHPEADKDGSKYNYNDLLFKSIMFYEAQRSGKLPKNNRIPWRGDSALHDKGAKGQDLTGGWYDAGDNVKFNFPMSWSTTILAWGFLKYGNAYSSAAQTQHMIDSIKWPLDYFLKCHTGPEELYVQVGDGDVDHSLWGPPESMKEARPAFKIDASHPGSDVAMETAAAMAAGSLVFKQRNPTYAKNLLNHAKQLWEFGNKRRGLYSDAVPKVKGFYKSQNFTDELCWGSLWLYKATGDKKYLTLAQKTVDLDPAWGMSWDEKTAGNQVLLYEITKKDIYKKAVVATFKMWFPGGKLTYTPKGLAYRLEWGPLRYASNMALVALMAADLGIQPAPYRHWAMCQIHYAIGDTGYSYVIGFGKKYPVNAHHRASSCPNVPAPCGMSFKDGKQPNVHTLYGALVGGPNSADKFNDDRSLYQNTEVATDYNAGFQSAVAGLKSLYLRKLHPEQHGQGACHLNG